MGIGAHGSEQKENIAAHTKLTHIVGQYEQEASEHAFMHEASVQHYIFYDRLFKYVMEILMFASVLSLSIKEGAGQEESWITTLTLCLTGVSSGLARIAHTKDFKATATRHHDAFLSYGEMSRNLNRLLARDHETDELDSLVQETQHQITMLTKRSPDIPATIRIKTASNTQTAKSRADMQVRAIAQLVTQCKSGTKDVVDKVTKMNMRELRDVLIHQRSPGTQTTDIIVPVLDVGVTPVQQNRLRHVMDTVESSSRQTLIESILLDADLSARGLQDYMESRHKS